MIFGRGEVKKSEEDEEEDERVNMLLLLSLYPRRAATTTTITTRLLAHRLTCKKDEHEPPLHSLTCSSILPFLPIILPLLKPTNNSPLHNNHHIFRSPINQLFIFTSLLLVPPPPPSHFTFNHVGRRGQRQGHCIVGEAALHSQGRSNHEDCLALPQVRAARGKDAAMTKVEIRAASEELSRHGLTAANLTD